MADTLQAYCVKCKTKRELAQAEAVYTATGTPGTRGTCPVCGTTLFRMGSTEAHTSLPKPEKVERPPREKKVTKSGKKAKAGGKKKAARSKVAASKGSFKGRLVIVESPAKARTVQRFLGKDYLVKASIGHVRDLLRSKLSVDVEDGFKPQYRVPNEKRDVVKEIKHAAAKAKEVFLATDPDREGEAIAWHLLAAADIDGRRVKRVVFHEITEEAIDEAFAHPGEVKLDLVNAQQARRILDRLVGYNITELLWDKVRNRLSAGRVQSVALRLVVDREHIIQTFIPEEYWTIQAELAKREGNGSAGPSNFVARLIKIGSHDADLHVMAEVTPHVAILEKSAYRVVDVKRGTRQRRPAPPFTTSTLQQEASRTLNFNARRTMRVAQQLYEGIDVGDGQVGLITYMRTDSTAIAKEAQHTAREFIVETYGKEFAPARAPVYKTQSKSAQEAHEAIRPTRVTRTPESLQRVLSRDQLKLYTLIWQRFVASQMANAVYTTMRVDIKAGLPDQDAPYLFRVSGSLVKFPGFLRVYEEARDIDDEPDEDTGRILPDMTPDELLRLIRVIPRQSFTQPPPRYTEATLVKALEDNGIGRPSTYAPTVAVIQNRDYVTREGRYLVPTETGQVVNDLLVDYFPDILNYNFTANLESQLDQIADGKQEWVPFLSEFYSPFEQQLKHARAHMPAQRQQEKIGRDCPVCGNSLVMRYGRFGKFIGCSTYPECKYTEPWLDKIGVACPRDGGDLVEKKTRRGRTFYGCANYPECEFTSWKRPIATPCPECGGLLVEYNRNKVQCLSCERIFPREDFPEAFPEAAAGEEAD